MRVTGHYVRKGKCEVCGRPAKRTRSFVAPTYPEMETLANRWTEPVRHAKCEWLPVPQRKALA